MKATSSSIEKIRSAVLPSWRGSPLTHERTRSAPGSGTSSAVVTHGPNGHDPSKPFARVHCGSRPWRSRALRSSAVA